MRVLRIEARDFSAYEKLDLDISGVHRVCITGLNGSGKSSILQVIEFAMWGKCNSPLDDMIREGEEQARVVVTFESAGATYRVERSISRGRGSKVSFAEVVDGELKQARKHIKKDTQARIDAIVGLNYEAMMNASFMTQGDSARFMRAGATSRVALLTQMFGIEQYEVWAKEASTRYTAAKAVLREVEGRLEALEGTLAFAETVEAALAESRGLLAAAESDRATAQAHVTAGRADVARLQASVGHLESLKRQLNDAIERLSRDKSFLDGIGQQRSEAQTQAAAPMPTWPDLGPNVYVERITATEGAIATLRQQDVERATVAAQLPGLKRTLEDMQSRLAIRADVPCGGEGIYATCQFLARVPTDDAIRTQAEAVEQADARLKEMVAVEPGIADYEAELARLRREDAAYRDEARRRESETRLAESKLDEAKRILARLDELEREATARVGQAEMEIARVQSEITPLQDSSAELEAAKAAVATHERDLTQAEARVASKKADLASLERQAAEIEFAKAEKERFLAREAEAKRDADTYKVLAAAFGRQGIPKMIVENGIPAIEEHANRVLEQMPGGYQVRLETQRELKSREGHEEVLDIVVEIGGTRRPYERLSGGEKYRVDFAIRVALSQVLARRGGQSVRTLIIDEGFGTQDPEGREAMLQEFLSIADDFDLVIVVSHIDEVIARFPARIETRKTARSAEARLVA